MSADFLISDYEFSTPLQIYYSFDTSDRQATSAIDPDLGTIDLTVSNSLEQFEINGAIAAMQAWQNIANINFEQADASAGKDANLTFSELDLPTGGVGLHQNETDTNQNVIHADIFIDEFDVAGFYEGGYAYTVLVHEIGHILGLKHPNNDPYDSNYDWEGTIMSYNETDTMPLTPMYYDILAIQEIYGANITGTNVATTYTLDGVYSTGGVNSSNVLSGTSYQYVAETIWDSDGGIDLFDASSYSGDSYIDLREGAGNVTTVGNTKITIADGANIENAIGGSGHDIIFGNGLDNTLDGGAGDNYLAGGSGADSYIIDADSGYTAIKDLAGEGNTLELQGRSVNDTFESYYFDDDLYVKITGSDGSFQWLGFEGAYDPDTGTVSLPVGTTTMSDGQLPGGLGGAIGTPASLPLPPGWIPPIPGALGDMGELGGLAFPPWIPGAAAALAAAAGMISPLVLDLDGDGVELISMGDSIAYWDIDQDGFAEVSGWVDADDALLAIDINGDGIINDHSELFGNDTTDGFTLLTDLDSNSDGVIDANDTAFADLLLWQDLNEDGFSDAGELFSLADKNIVSINLGATAVDYDLEGNHVSHESSFTFSDSSTGTIVDAWFAYDDVNTRFAGEYQLDPRTIYMPQLRGYGELADLNIAMSQDKTLLNMVQDLMDKSLSDLLVADGSVDQAIKDILYRWAGVDYVDPSSRGHYLEDARTLEFQEKLFGQDYVQTIHNSSDPRWDATHILEQNFIDIFNHLSSSMLTQVAFSELFTGDVSYDFLSDSFSGITGVDTTIFSTIETVASASIDPGAVWHEVIRTIDYTFGLDNLSVSETSALNTAIQNTDSSFTIDDLLAYNYLYDDGVVVEGDATAETINGTDEHDYIDGNAGNDTIYGYDGMDKLIGGAGDDILSGGNHSDVYVFGFGDGHDLIQDHQTMLANQTDVLRFEPDVTTSDVTLSRIANDNDLTVTLSDGSSFTIDDQFNVDIGIGAYYFDRIEAFEFYDGSNIVWTHDDIMDQLITQGTTTGNDTVYGFTREDVFEKSAGDDYLAGGYEGDTYHFGRGAGHDTIYDKEYGLSIGDDIDRIVMDSDITPSDIEVLVPQDDVTDIILRITDTGDTLRIDGQNKLYSVGSPDFEIEEIVFDDGTVWTPEFIRQKYLSEAATSGDDTIYGFYTNDVIDGGAGNDRLEGGGGSDTYLFGVGSGNDVIHDYIEYISWASDDTVSFTGGLNSTDVSISKVDDDLQIDVNSSTDSLIIEDYFRGSGQYWVVENLSFTDTTLTYSDIYTMTIGGMIVTGTENGETLSGGSGHDLIYGLGGDDTLNGLQGNDILFGGDGNDTLNGYSGDDIYVVGNGDVIKEYTGLDEIVFGEGITLEDLSFKRIEGGSLDDLQISWGDGNSILIDSYFYSSSDRYVVENIRFSDDSVYNLSANPLTQLGTSGDDTLNGTNTSDKGVNPDDFLYGLEGNDTLNGNGGNDYLDGGTGNDVLSGDYGNDTYYFSRGHGADTIDNDGSTDDIDTIIYDSGVDYDQLWFENNSGDLQISVIGTNDSVTIENWWINSRYQTDYIESGDGYELTAGEVQTLVNAMASMTKPPVGQTELTAQEHAALDTTLASVWDQAA